METNFNIKVAPIDKPKLKTGMLVVWGDQLCQINGKEDGMWLLGDKYTNISLEPEFYATEIEEDGTRTQKRVFTPVELVIEIDNQPDI